MKKKTYEQPQMTVIEVKAADIICTSMISSQNEEWETGSTEDWYKL